MQVNAEALLLHHRKGDDGLLLQLRLLRQMALQGWAPAVRELGRMAAAEEEEGLEGVLEVRTCLMHVFEGADA